MSETNERDTHFASNAAVLQKRLVEWNQRQWQRINTGESQVIWFCEHEGEEDSKDNEQVIITRFIYDLVRHTIEHIDPYHLDALPYDEIPPRIPDMTALPE